ncbi:MAG: hypothetical protein E6K73_12280 [Candidatus Eisenbacteria bacterium]|uniref:Uncharacterized protein n=1 Tax=Eiseniibacteriota bacterium TaxID=2212470 RepID=A0A538SA77_UNCEI|nr:MAG: hypothetical protein E6K73_12280 [Candidatus Eisenbacteria bacterium]
MRRTIAILTLSCLLLSGVPRPGGAAVNVSRTGSENPMVEVARSIIWGGVAGLVVGSAMALASNGDNSGDIIKWSFVGGTFLGLGFGIYHVTTRPQASAALDGRGLGLGSAAPLGGSRRGGFAPTSSAGVPMRSTRGRTRRGQPTTAVTWRSKRSRSAILSPEPPSRL